MIAILLYGIPCSGKSFLARKLQQENNYYYISVDKIITTIKENPSIDDFQCLSNLIIENIKNQMHLINRNFVIEVGCLIKKESSENLINFISRKSIAVYTFVLNEETSVIKKRAIKRNMEILTGKSQDLLIDDIQAIGKFNDHLKKNAPSEAVYATQTQVVKFLKKLGISV